VLIFATILSSCFWPDFQPYKTANFKVAFPKTEVLGKPLSFGIHADSGILEPEPAHFLSGSYG
jgi:hypothetical protein